MSTTETHTAWQLSGKFLEFCNCLPGCTCNFSGFPTSPDGSCRAVVGNVIESGNCGDVDLSGINVAAIVDWPQAIHDGGGKAVFVIPPEVTDDQVGALAQIFTGQLGGMPWEILGTTFDVAGMVRAPVNITGSGVDSGIEIPGVGTASGSTLRNPVTNEPHQVTIDLHEQGMIWDRGQCGQGNFKVAAEGIDLDFEDTNWILGDFSWSNRA